MKKRQRVRIRTVSVPVRYNVPNSEKKAITIPLLSPEILSMPDSSMLRTISHHRKSYVTNRTVTSRTQNVRSISEIRIGRMSPGVTSTQHRREKIGNKIDEIARGTID